jgi:hypothetical protein
MSEAYPKRPGQISIKVTRHDIEDGIRRGRTDEVVLLDEKLKEYLVKMGSMSAHVFNVVVQLLIHGKVRLDFQTYLERLELVDPKDKLTKVQAIALVDDFIAIHRGEDKEFLSTQQIVIRHPKHP